MKRFALLASLVLSLATTAYSQQIHYGEYPGYDGVVSSLGSNFFVFEVDGVTMKVFADANTVFRINHIAASAAYVVKNTHVRVAGATDRVGTMNAQLVTIFPSTDSVSGTVKKVENKFFIMETEKGKAYKVFVAKFTKYVSGKAPVTGGVSSGFGTRRDPGKKEDGSKIKVGSKVDVTPVTNADELLDAWEVNISAPLEDSPK
jgi:hypothetical protein